MKFQINEMVDIEMSEIFHGLSHIEKVEMFKLLKHYMERLGENVSIGQWEYDKAIKVLSENYHRIKSQDEDLIKSIAKRL